MAEVGEKVSSFKLKNSCISLSGNIELFYCLWKCIHGCELSKGLASDYVVSQVHICPLIFCFMMLELGFYTSTLPPYFLFASHTEEALEVVSKVGRERKDFPIFLLSSHLRFLWSSPQNNFFTLAAAFRSCGSSLIKFKICPTLVELTPNSPVSEKPD